VEPNIDRFSNLDDFLTVPAKLFYIEPDEVADFLDDLREASAGLSKARRERDTIAELIGVKNTQIALYDTLTAYRTHNLQVPKLLALYQTRLEERRQELDPGQSQTPQR
jgi:hypothetical protein